MKRNHAAMLRVARHSVVVQHAEVDSIPEDLMEELKMAPVLPGVAGGKWTPAVRLHAMEFFYANKQRYDRLSYMRRVRIREMLIYMGFVAIFTYVAMQARDTSASHFYIDGWKNYIEKTGMSAAEAPNGNKNFFGVGQVADAYGFFRSVLVPRMRPNGDTLPNGQTAPHTVLGSNIIIGDVVIRQNRVQSESCKLPLSVLSRNPLCYPDFDADKEDSTPLPSWYTNLYALNGPNATVPSWFSWSPSVGPNYANSALKVTYGTGGFTMKINLDNITKAIADLNLAEAVGWIDYISTRAVFTEMTLYNPNINKFMTAFYLIEFSPSAGLVESTTYRVVNLYRFGRTSSLIDLVVEAVMYLFVAFYFVVEVVKIKQEGRQYWTEGFNYLAILNILVFGVVLLLLLYTILTAQSMFANNTLTTIDPHQLHALAYYTYQVYNFNAFNALLTWIRLTKYLDLLSGKTRQLQMTLSRSAGDVLIVLLIFIVIYFGYSLAFHLAFGQDIDDFAFIDSSLIAMYLSLLGVFSFESLKASNRILGPILFVSYIFVMVFCILNMFLTVVMKSYDHVSFEIEKQPDELPSHIRKEIFRKIKAFFTRRKSSAKVVPVPHRHGAIMNGESLTQSQKKAQENGTEVVSPEDDDDGSIVDAENVFLNDEELAEIFMAEEPRLKMLGIHSVDYMKKVADVDFDGEVSVAEIMNFKSKLDDNENENEDEEMHLIMKVLERTNQIVQEQRSIFSLLQRAATAAPTTSTTSDKITSARSPVQANLAGLFSSNRGFGPSFPAPQNGGGGR